MPQPLMLHARHGVSKKQRGLVEKMEHMKGVLVIQCCHVETLWVRPNILVSLYVCSFKRFVVFSGYFMFVGF